MTIELRPYQKTVKGEVYAHWNQGAMNVLVEQPTGSGKTFFMADVFHDHKGAACAIAHRQELVSQISLALARAEVYHNIIAASKTVQFIANYHNQEINRSYFHPQAPVTVASVDTLLRRDLGSWADQVTLWAQDEAHHTLKENKWGKAAKLFRNARGLGVTATPIRADGSGLGRHADGLFDVLIEGPTMRELMSMGYLTDYRVFAPPSDMDLTDVQVSQRTGDYNPHQLRQASHKSHIVGDVVEQYLRIAAGRLGVTFAVDVETASEIAERYRQFGVRAEVVSAKTPDATRINLIRRFRNRELDQLVNVDLFGEGFDLPAIEVVSMARPTQSYSLFAQQFGRALRPMQGKDYAIIIDHVGNIIRHGLPDAPRVWSLDGRERGARGKRDPSVIPVTACENCMMVYERIKVACPFCGHRPEPQGRARPEQVDGDLFELSPDTLAQMRGEVFKTIESPTDLKRRMSFAQAPDVAIASAVKHRRENFDVIQSTRRDLVHQINCWGAHWEAQGDNRQEAYRRFFHRFGMDVLTAQMLSKKDAEELTQKIKDDYANT